MYVNFATELRMYSGQKYCIFNKISELAKKNNNVFDFHKSPHA